MSKKDKEVIAYQRKKIAELEDELAKCKYKLGGDEDEDGKERI